jgi:hypothetical protein
MQPVAVDGLPDTVIPGPLVSQSVGLKCGAPPHVAAVDPEHAGIGRKIFASKAAAECIVRGLGGGGNGVVSLFCVAHVPARHRG